MTTLTGLGEALVKLRKQRELNGREVADRAGITKAMLSSYENEHARPTLRSLERILDGMDADLGDLAAALGQGAPEPRGIGALLGELLERTEARHALADTVESLGRLATVVAAYLREEPETGASGAAERQNV